jgi:hypothetical protein
VGTPVALAMELCEPSYVCRVETEGAEGAEEWLSEGDGEAVPNRRRVEEKRREGSRRVEEYYRTKLINGHRIKSNC